ncbi:MAG: RagB/SusD family nutrient uptake outer membrane protein, partial [Cytophagaceae bacterium]
MSELNTIRANQNSFVGSLALNYKVNDNLTIRPFLSMDYRSIRGRSFSDPRTADGFNVRGRIQDQLNENKNFLTNITANYNKIFAGKHDVSVLLGAEYRSDVNENLSTNITNVPTPDFQYASAAALPVGINGGWGGVRTTSAFVDKFSNSSGDQRSNFHTAGQSLAISDISDFTQGYAVEKFRNVDVNGNAGSDTAGDFVDTDFPMFRLADVYLMFAECALRTGQNTGEGLGYVNLVRTRAYGNASGNVGSIDLQFILDERARELYFEGHRRTDLVRFGKFTGGSYVWPFKGNTPAGSPTPSFRNIFPIPA